ncbi:MAG: NADH:flavin oxidoreductase [Desulfobacteraceae bacterium]|nr:NADH:flavin oxidoreductase [Desulfobacteraceae bacterium]
MKQLFEPANIGNIKLKNRFVRSATWEGMAEESGHLNDKIFEIYENLSKGGAAAIITGYAYVLKDEQPSPRMFGAYDDSFIEDYRKLTDIVHKNNSKIILQLAYGGSMTWFNVGQREIWGPSAVLNKISGVTPKEMTKEDIKTLVKAFGESSRRAMEGGFDGVEIHAGHGYLLNHFLSPNFNIRKDEYGGTSENRARIIYEIFDSIRAHTSKDFPVLIKLNCSDFMENKGFLFEECKELCKNLSEKGITAVEISGGPVFRAPKTEKEPTKQVTLSSKESYFSEYAKDIASEIDAPVILVGGNRSVEVMETILNETQIEFFSLSRPLLSEPDLINKWEKDKTAKPRCTSCSLCFTPEGNMCILDREKK